MADYVVEPIAPQTSLADLISQAIDAGATDDEIRAAVAKRKAREPKPSGPAAGEYTSGPLSQQEMAKSAQLAKDPMAFGDVDVRDPKWQRLTGNTPADQAEREQRAEARGFLGFAAGGLAGMAASGAARALGAGPGLSAAAGGAASGALPSAMEGNSPTDVAKDAAIGAAVPTVGSMLAGAGRAVMASRGAKARALIEGYGGKVGLTDSGSGLPEFQGRGKITDADIGEQARQSGQQLLAENDRRLETQGEQPYAAEVANIKASGMGKNLASAEPARDKMIELMGDKRLQPDVRERLRRDLMSLDRGHGTKWVMSESDMNDYRKQYFDRAQFDSRNGAPGAPEWAAIGGEFKGLVDKGPFAGANATYEKAIGEHGDFREAFGMPRAAAPNEQIDERRIANALARRGQTTTTAGIQQGDGRMEALLGGNPQLERVATAPELLRAKADLQIGIPEHGGLAHRVEPNGLVAHNLNPLTGRVLYQPARAASALGGSMVGAAALNNQFAALQAMAQQKKQREAVVIHTLFGNDNNQQGNDNAQGY